MDRRSRKADYPMLFYIQMRWNIDGRMTLDEMWDRQVEEGKAAAGSIDIIGMYKVASQRRVFAIIDVPSADELDRVLLGRLPLADFLDFEAVWPIREFSSFLEDCKVHFKKSSEGAIDPLPSPK
jgi:muconolactone D-isomerase